VKNWIDIIRPDDYFNLIDLNTDNTIPVDFKFGSSTARTSYNEMYHIRNIPDDFNHEPPTLAFHTPIYKNVDEEGLPHGSKPAAAQRYGNVTLLWGHFDCDATEELVCSAGCIADSYSMIQTIGEDDFIPHREDGFPAVIELINPHKHFYHGCLHRVGNHPAIKVDYVVATWFINGVPRRADGPCCITIKNYQEFWREGEYHGFKEEDHYLGWALDKSSIYEMPTGRIVTPRSTHDGINPDATELGHFLNNLHGKTDIFANRYFTDAQDEICFGADFL
jgi:hypothetical protein